ncbi:MAG: DUF5675 family protein [Acidobacteria bacterium]|nr:DUF5675 family protein [Acidobacteriota bacterium]
MHLRLQRRFTIKDTTLGELYVDDLPVCDTLEDPIREVLGKPVSEWKIAGKTAIPAGTYRLYLANSPKFGPDTISLEEVPGFSLIRIHAGNDDADTEGCILVGTAVLDPTGDGGNLSNSRVALKSLKEMVVPVLQAGEVVPITIRNPS